MIHDSNWNSWFKLICSLCNYSLFSILTYTCSTAMIYNGFHLHVQTVSFNSGAHLMGTEIKEISSFSLVTWELWTGLKSWMHALESCICCSLCNKMHATYTWYDFVNSSLACTTDICFFLFCCSCICLGGLAWLCCCGNSGLQRQWNR